jgi:F-type H+-transporting ATPase subunit epsilon
MARTTFKAEVLTPEGQVFNEDVEMVSTQTTIGSIGLLAGHEPVLARLEPTELRLYRSETDIVRFAQAEGYVQMSAAGALVLVEEAVPIDRLDSAALQERVAAARREAEAAQPESDELTRAQNDLKRAEVFLAIAGGGGPHR